MSQREQKKQPQQAERLLGKKKVRFCQVVVKIPRPVSSPTLTGGRKNKAWMTREEYEKIKRKARLIERDSREFGDGDLLTNTFNVQSTHVQYSCNKWSRLSRRGLEIRSNLEHGAQRERQRRNAVRCVLYSQRVQKRSGRVDPDHLAQVYALFTRDAREFAVKMGIADAFAASLEYRTQKPSFFLSQGYYNQTMKYEEVQHGQRKPNTAARQHPNNSQTRLEQDIHKLNIEQEDSGKISSLKISTQPIKSLPMIYEQSKENIKQTPPEKLDDCYPTAA